MVEKLNVSPNSQSCSFEREGFLCNRSTFMESCGAVPILMDNIQPEAVVEVLETAKAISCPFIEKLAGFATFSQVNKIETPPDITF